MIHPTAIIDASAKLRRDVSIGAYAVIGADVDLGDGCEVGHHVVIEGPTRMGKCNRIWPHAYLGAAPQDSGYAGEPTRIEMGDENIIREFATIHRGSPKDRGVTRIGNHNMFMAYSHVAHDCTVGSHVIMANAATLGGHVTVGDYVNIAGLCALHQFVRIGTHAMLGGGTMVPLDVPPFVMASGNHAKLFGLNRRGLERRGFSSHDIRQLRHAYKLLFRSDLRLADAIAAVEAERLDSPCVGDLIDFMKTTKRGVTR